MPEQPERRCVVGGAVLRAGSVLAARRLWPETLAGRWELPGGMVEPGENHEAALLRELREELGMTGTVLGWLDGVSPIRVGLELRVAIVSAVGEPVLVDHDEARWLTADELDSVDWLDPDRPFLAQVRAMIEP